MIKVNIENDKIEEDIYIYNLLKEILNTLLNLQ